MPVVQITTMTGVAKAFGVPRVWPGHGIAFPVGDPERPREAERAWRVEWVHEALALLTQRVPAPQSKEV